MPVNCFFVLRFIVREFYFDEKELKCEREEMMKLASDKKQQYVSTYRAGCSLGNLFSCITWMVTGLDNCLPSKRGNTYTVS